MSPRWSSHPEFFICKIELIKCAFFSSKPVVRTEGECECESTACLGWWKRVLWGGIVHPSTSWHAEGVWGRCNKRQKLVRILPQRLLLTVSRTQWLQATSLPPPLPSYLKTASSVTEGSGLFAGIQLLLLIPFKPSPTRFPGQLLFCLKPSSGFPSHWEENISSRPKSHVQSNPRFI